jgi:single-stranded-DNA-specific exonuclease
MGAPSASQNLGLGAAAIALPDVERSFTSKRWIVNASDDRQALALAQRLGVPEIVGRVMATRGIGPESAESFLDPRVRDLLPDPSDMLDMDAAIDRLARAIQNGEGIAVFGDYDVDGATSSALLARFLTAVGAVPQIYIPDRQREGYGPNARALISLKEGGAGVVITVDCGVSAFAALEAAADAGLDVIVVDHHEAEARLPRAAAVVDPNRLDETSPHRNLAAVGMAFLLAVGLNRALRRAGWYADRPEPDLMKSLDLVALGTVCDVMPLVGLNRALVAQGLRVMAGRENCGLRALADVAGLSERPGAYHLGFVLGPRVNAGGRVGRSDLGVRLLTTEDAAEAARLAHTLDEHNRDRQAIEANVLEGALQALEVSAEIGPVVFVAGEGWHPGVVGIVASRLKERFNRPAFVVSVEGAAATGSARSVEGVDVGAAIIAARQSGLIAEGGGHAMAAGFKLAREKLDDLHRFLAERLDGAIGADARVPRLRLDGVLSVTAATLELIDALEHLAPFGVGNPEPRFVIAGTRVSGARVVGDDHVSCTLAGAGGGRLQAIAFRSLVSGLGQGLLNAQGAPVHVAGRLRHDRWRGRSRVQFFIDDAASAW